MSTPKDMAESELRDADGYPLSRGPNTRPRSRLECQRDIISPQINQSTDNSTGKNEALPWTVLLGLSCLLAGISLGVSLRQDKITDAKMGELRAEMRAEFADGVARATALAELARKEASTAKDQIDYDIVKRKATEAANNGN
jgi:hypothetical protein